MSYRTVKNNLVFKIHGFVFDSRTDPKKRLYWTIHLVVWASIAEKKGSFRQWSKQKKITRWVESIPCILHCIHWSPLPQDMLALALSWDSRLSNNTAGSFINWMPRSPCFDRDHEGQLLLRWPCPLDEHGHHTEELLYSSVPLWSTSTLKTVQWTCISGRDGRDGHVRRICGIQCAALYCRDCFQACCVNCVKQKRIAWSNSNEINIYVIWMRKRNIWDIKNDSIKTWIVWCSLAGVACWESTFRTNSSKGHRNCGRDWGLESESKVKASKRRAQRASNS